MNCISWLSLPSIVAVVAVSGACSPEFTACEAPSCARGGAGGEAGVGFGNGGSSGAGASDTPAAGKAGAGIEGGAEEPELFGACSKLGQMACGGHALAQRLACDG